MFWVDIEIRWPSSKPQTVYREPLTADYMQATANKIDPNVESLCIPAAFLRLDSTPAFHNIVALPKSEIRLNLFYSATLFSPRARGSIVVKAPNYKPEGRGIYTR
jgi:hypothetical protein